MRISRMVLACICIAGIAAGRAQTPAVSSRTAPPAARSSIHGTIVDHTGQVCEGAHVALLLASETAPRTAISDNEGRYVFGDLPSCVFTLTVSADGFTPKTVHAALTASQSLEEPPLELLVTSESEVEVNATRTEVAQEQLHLEERQRVLGVMPNFFVAYDTNAQALTARQKFHLAWKNEQDPFTAMGIVLSAAIEQGSNTYPSWGQGSAGFTRRFSADYGGDVVGTMLGSALLPSLFHQDPRFFFKADGTRRERVWYAIQSEWICRGDNGQKQFNYSGLIGSLAATGLTRFFFPAADRNSINIALRNIAIGKATGAVQNIFQELFGKRFTHNGPGAGSSLP
jgi:hypothetical protein